MKSKIVYLVDDDQGALETLGDIASSVAQVRAFKGPAAALKAIDEGQKVDLIITDIAMPLTNGLEFVKEVRARNLNIPVIIVSGNASRSDALEALHLGAFDLFEKPYEVNLIRHAIRRALAFGTLRGLNEDLFESMSLIVESTRELLQNYEKKYLEAEKKLFDAGLVTSEDKKQVEWQAKAEGHLSKLNDFYEALLHQKITIREILKRNNL